MSKELVNWNGQTVAEFLATLPPRRERAVIAKTKTVNVRYHKLCVRCGGTGEYSRWHGECWRCGGRGIDPTPAHEVFRAPEHWEKLRERREKARAKRDAESRTARFRALLSFAREHRGVLALLREHRERVARDTRYRITFIGDIEAKLRARCTLTTAQIQALCSAMEDAHERWERIDAEIQAEAVAPRMVEGRRTLIGKLVSMQLYDSEYGAQWKGLVVLDEGNKVFGTVPRALVREINQDNLPVHVQFTATVKPKDAHFGFFSRPSKAAIIQTAGEQ